MIRAALLLSLFLLSACRPPQVVPDAEIPVPVPERTGPTVERMEGVAWRYCLDWVGTVECKITCEIVDNESTSCLIRSIESYILTCTEDSGGGLWCEDVPVTD